MKTSPNTYRFMDLLREARSGRVVLPQFQRNFVWGRDDITELLASMLEGFFIGSFLLLRAHGKASLPFGVRALEGIPLDEDKLNPAWMVLDGQQRLTSLHYVFAAPDIPVRGTKYPYRFFLDLGKIATGQIADAIWSERAEYVKDLAQREEQFKRLQLPFTAVEKWDQWRDSYADWLEDTAGTDARDHFRYTARPAWNTVVDRLRDFNVPTIDIEAIDVNNSDQVAEVCAIFEKMNSTGVRLSVYDLLTARMHKYGVYIHELWKETVSLLDRLNAVTDGKPDVYGVYLLRTIALLRNKDVKGKTLINLDPTDFEKDWWRAAEYMDRALKRIVSIGNDGFGAFDHKWAPYTTMIAPLAALLAVIDEKKLGASAYQAVRKWYWASVFTERYAGAVESVSYRDYQDLLGLILGEPKVPVAFAEADATIVNNERFSLRGNDRINSVYKGVMCLVTLRGAKDFMADDAIEFHTLDDHHIFPQAYLRQVRESGVPIPYNASNSILNRTLISSHTNRRISKMQPSDYVETLIPESRRADILDSHFINEEGYAALASNDFEAFLQARDKALVAEIRRRLTL